MTEILTFIAANGAAVMAILAAAHGLAVAIVNLTPTPKDDEVLATVYPWIEYAAGILTKQAKQ